MSPWNDERDAQLKAYRSAGMSWDEVGELMGVTAASARGRLGRLKSGRVKREYHRLGPSRRIGSGAVTGQPCKYPYAPDDTCPDFAWDDEHCAAVLAEGGFKVLVRRAA
jgi:hypothetical protein